MCIYSNTEFAIPFDEHLIVLVCREAFSAKVSVRKQIVDASRLLQPVLKTETDGIGCANLDRRELDGKTAYIRLIFSQAKALSSFICRITNREHIPNAAFSVTNWKFQHLRNEATRCIGKGLEQHDICTVNPSTGWLKYNFCFTYPSGAIVSDGHLDFSACKTHNYREFTGGFSGQIKASTSGNLIEGYRQKVIGTESVSLKGKQKTVYMITNSNTTKHAVPLQPHKHSKSINNTANSALILAYLNGLRPIFQKKKSIEHHHQSQVNSIHNLSLPYPCRLEPKICKSKP